MTFPEWITFHNVDVIAALLIVAVVAYVACRVIDAVRVVREARDERSVRHALYPAPDLEARGTVIELEIPAPSLDQAVRMVGGDGWRNR